MIRTLRATVAAQAQAADYYDAPVEVGATRATSFIAMPWVSHGRHSRAACMVLSLGFKAKRKGCGMKRSIVCLMCAPRTLRWSMPASKTCLRTGRRPATGDIIDGHDRAVAQHRTTDNFGSENKCGNSFRDFANPCVGDLPYIKPRLAKGSGDKMKFCNVQPQPTKEPAMPFATCMRLLRSASCKIFRRSAHAEPHTAP